MPAPARITVLMSVYNGARFLPGAIESILSQSFADFELLIIDDASKDDSISVAEFYTDPRIRLVRNDKNLGLAPSLNKGLDLARGEYVARMDCDDVSITDRLSMQIDLMDTHPDIGICGTWIRLFGDHPGEIVRYYTDPDFNRSLLLFDPPVAHPSVMIRKSAFARYGLYYNESFRHAQDFELWVRASEYVKISNVPRVLLQYRTHPAQAGNHSLDSQQKFAGKVRLWQLKRLQIEPTEEEFRTHQFLSRVIPVEITMDMLENSKHWLRKIQKANERQEVFPEPAFRRSLGMRWFYLCYMASGLGMRVWRVFLSSPLSRLSLLNLKLYSNNALNLLLARE